MKLGLHYWNFTIPGDPALIAATLGESARIADQAGFSSFTVMDHYFQMEGMARLTSRCSRVTRRSASSPRRPSV